MVSTATSYANGAWTIVSLMTDAIFSVEPRMPEPCGLQLLKPKSNAAPIKIEPKANAKEPFLEIDLDFELCLEFILSIQEIIPMT